MPKLKKNSRKLDMPAAVRTKASGLILLLVGVILGTLIVVGQQAEPMTKKQTLVFNRFENAIKEKEPKFKPNGKLVRNNQNEKYVLLGWQSGDDIVSTTTYEFSSPEAAADMMRKSLAAPRSVPVQTIKLTQLGDEAHMSSRDFSKEGQTYLLLRKGKYFIVMSASSQDLVKRFAKHMAAEIDN